MEITQCPICLSIFGDNVDVDKGFLNCIHVFCYPCIRTWARLSTKCPLCKSTFESILKVSQQDPTKSETVPIPKRGRLPLPPDDVIILDDDHVIILDDDDDDDDDHVIILDDDDDDHHIIISDDDEDYIEEDRYCTRVLVIDPEMEGFVVYDDEPITN